MKTYEVPQDDENMLKGTVEIQYALDENGNYIQIHSSGWKIKNDILRDAWKEADNDTLNALNKVKTGEKSPIYFYMIKNLMDFKMLAEYAETYKFIVKRHCKPKYFKKIGTKKLEKYAEIFNISVNQLLNVPDKIENSIDERTKRQ